ncbi:YgjP-like metallopeptidase domain-containing protein, partial [Arthrospira platensis SPKY2]
YGEQTIAYQLTVSQRKTLGISVLPDLTVEVTAPQGTELAQVEAALRRRAPWILRQQQEFARYLPHTPPRRYISGESHRYLGKQYRLKVVEISKDEPDIEWVKLTRGYLWVRVINKEDREHVGELVEGWYRTQARRVFAERLDACYPRVEPLGVPRPEIQIR